MSWRRHTGRRADRVKSNSLVRVRPGRHIVIFGGSQLGGSNTGQFGSLDLTLVGAPNNNIPAGVTLIRDGVTKAAYDAVHGIEPGIIEGFRAAGLTSGLKVLTRIVGATGAIDWINTHFATVAADVVTAGLTPSLVCYATGGEDGLSNNTISAAATTLRRVHNLVRSTWPGAGFVVSGLMSTDLTAFPKQVELRALGNEIFSEARDGTTSYVDPKDFESYLQTDVTHLNSQGIVRLGLYGYFRRFGGSIT